MGSQAPSSDYYHKNTLIENLFLQKEELVSMSCGNLSKVTGQYVMRHDSNLNLSKDHIIPY
jgi:hypothetical protein